ncbi:MAG: helix-turn-helix transcriptional regulator, partial [Deltaproteobacteria bacterium]|nr:helix-turn-helix transcriptional regulator [Deltaproteobacteria bacterium]
MKSKDSALAKKLGAAVRRRRNELAWSQAVLAEHINSSVEYISMIERGARIPSVPTLVALAASLGLSSDELLGSGADRSRSEDVLVMLARAVPDDARGFTTKVLAALAEPTFRGAGTASWTVDLGEGTAPTSVSRIRAR